MSHDEQSLSTYLGDIRTELSRAFDSVTFGMSQYQIDHFVVNKETPERAYRQVVLELNERYKALTKAELQRKRNVIKLKKLEAAIAAADGLDRELLEIDREELLFDIEQEDILAKDALAEADRLWQHYQALPKIDRAQFEASEQAYWERRLFNDMHRHLLTTGTVPADVLQAVSQMGLNPTRALVEAKEFTQEHQRLLAGDVPPAELTS